MAFGPPFEVVAAEVRRPRTVERIQTPQMIVLLDAPTARWARGAAEPPVLRLRVVTLVADGGQAPPERGVHPLLAVSHLARRRFPDRLPRASARHEIDSRARSTLRVQVGADPARQTQHRLTGTKAYRSAFTGDARIIHPFQHPGGMRPCDSARENSTRQRGRGSAARSGAKGWLRVSMCQIDSVKLAGEIDLGELGAALVAGGGAWCAGSARRGRSWPFSGEQQVAWVLGGWAALCGRYPPVPLLGVCAAGCSHPGSWAAGRRPRAG